MLKTIRNFGSNRRVRQSISPFLDRIRGRIKLSELVAEQTQITRKGRAIKALCPFHNEKTPSFSIDDVKGLYHCFGCGAGGDHFTFVAQTKNLEFMEAVEYLADKAGVILPKNIGDSAKSENRPLELLEEACAWYQEQLRRSVGEAAREYLAERQINETSVNGFRLGYAPAKGLVKFLESKGFEKEECVEAGVAIKGESEIYDRFKNRLIFPIVSDKNRVIAFGGRILTNGEPKYLNSPETAVFQKRYALYGLDRARTRARGQVIIVEGYIDAIRLRQEGIANAVAPLGTALTVEQLQKAWRLAPDPVIAFDGDAAGEKAALAAITKAAPYLSPNHSLKILFLPKGEDPDSFVRKEGAEAFKKLSLSATPVHETLWRAAIAPYDPLNLAPEEFVAVKNRLREFLARMENKDLRQAYVKQFDYLLNRLQRTGLEKSALSDGSARRALAPAKKIDAEKILLVTLLNHPYLWKEVGDAFMKLEFATDANERERLRVVEYFLNHAAPLEPVWPEDCEELKKMATQAFYTRVPFAKIGYDQATAKKGWWETYANFTGNSLKADESRYVDNLKNDPTASNWERLKALKRNSEVIERLENSDG